MASHVIIRMRHSACNEEFEEEKLEDHIRIRHQFNSRPESEYLASLERRIKVLEDKSSRYP
ncbi:MAG: hypothetical protein WAZ77_17565 [Candidatus Nitrosopolaris sp.]|jgi:hypothetical protein